MFYSFHDVINPIPEHLFFLPSKKPKISHSYFSKSSTDEFKRYPTFFQRTEPKTKTVEVP